MLRGDTGGAQSLASRQQPIAWEQPVGEGAECSARPSAEEMLLCAAFLATLHQSWSGGGSSMLCTPDFQLQEQ